MAEWLAARADDRGTVLDGLLGEARADSAEYPVDLANHGPMVLTILQRLGAPDTRLRAYLSAYRTTNGTVPLPPPVSPIAADVWTHGLGTRAREGDYRAFFDRQVADLGSDDAIRRYLPALLPGIAASALHPLMRLAYGILRDDPAEVAAALAYWACTYLPLPPASEAAPDTDDPAVVLARVGSMPGLRALPAQSHLWHGIRAAAADPEFAPAVDWLRIGPDTIGRLAATALALFAGTGSFAALHAVTGTHWIRIVHAVCPDPLLVRHFWQAAAAMVPEMGFPALPSEAQMRCWRELPCPEWPAITAAALASEDEHDISLVFSAREEQRLYGDRLYRVVAARRLGLIA